jgi:soluble lytic murein transglycosylase-like protein
MLIIAESLASATLVIPARTASQAPHVAETRMVAAYNAGPSRAVEWSRSDPAGNPQSGAEFINRIDIPSTRAYVISIMERYRQLKNAKSSSAALQQTSPAR